MQAQMKPRQSGKCTVRVSDFDRKQFHSNSADIDAGKPGELTIAHYRSAMNIQTTLSPLEANTQLLTYLSVGQKIQAFMWELSSSTKQSINFSGSISWPFYHRCY